MSKGNTYAVNEPDTEELKYKTESLHVHTSGIYSDPDDFMICPNGSSDYLLIYLSEGVAYICNSDAEDARMTQVNAGTVVLYRPGEPQYLKAYGNHCRYWVHFLGFGVDKLLDNCGFGQRRFFRVINDGSIEKIFIRIYHELQITAPFFNDVCNGLLIELLTSIARREAVGGVQSDIFRLNPAIEYMYIHYAENISMDKYAELCFMSMSHFCRQFKINTGFSPVNFLKNIRMTTAMDLLTNTKVSVSDIAGMVGYPDALYFSRLFKKYTEKSPSKYRNEE
jgi:AraC family transcriptional regulator of arabinose operon